MQMPAMAQELRYIATYHWPSKSFQGLSGLEVWDAGRRFATISDRGWYMSGNILRGPDGVITDMEVTQHLPILGNDGRPVSARRVGDWSDAEGLAIAPDGTHWISFERWSRVQRHSGPEQPGEWIKDHPDFAAQADNRQLEALALHPDGTLYTLPERPVSQGFPLYALQDGRWQVAGHIPEQNRFAIVGADFDAQGRLYLLERKLILGLWWQSRIRRLALKSPDSPEILWTSRQGAFFNLEGIAVWQTPENLHVTLVSDDNGNPEEVTQIVELTLRR